MPTKLTGTKFTLSDDFAVTRSTISVVSPVNVKTFGARGDGVTDDTAAIQAAIEAAGAAGGGRVVLPRGTYKITAKLTVSASNVSLIGEGGDMSHDVGSQGAGAGTRLDWAGAADGTMVEFISPSGASNQKKQGGGAADIFFACYAVAGIGLSIKSWFAGQFERLHFDNPKDTAIEVSCVSTLGEAADSQRNRFVQCSARCLESTNGGLLRLDGTSTANVSLNYFESCDVGYTNGTGFNLKNCDNNVFLSCRAFRASGTGNGVVFNGSNASAGATARSNMFIAFSGTSATTIIARGTSSFTHPSLANALLLLDSDNGTPQPTVEAGASAHWTFTSGIRSFDGQAGLALGEDLSGALTAQAARTNSSIYIVNGSDAHAIFATGDLAARWRLYVNSSSGALTLGRLAGSGGVVLSLDAIASYADDAAAATGGVAVGQIYRTDSTLKIRTA